MTREEMRDMVAQAIRDTSEVSINRNFFLDCADAAIALVLEEAAKVAAAESVRPGYTTNEHMMAHRIAAAIRALKESK